MDMDEKLAAALDRQFKNLPDRAAPESLTAAVLEMVRQYEARPWWQRSWFEWPISIRWVSGLAVFVMLGATGIVDLSSLSVWIDHAVDLLRQVAAIVDPMIGAVQSIAAGIPFYAWCLLAMACAMSWMATLGLGLVCYQLARTRKPISH